MKHLTGIGIIDLILTGVLILFMLAFPKLFDKVFPNSKSPNRIEGNFNLWLKANKNKLYYVVRKVENRKTSLTQYVDFYMYVIRGGKQVFLNITDFLPVELLNKLNSGQFYKRKSKFNGTWMFTDFDIVEFTNELNNVYGKIDLIRLDEDTIKIM